LAPAPAASDDNLTESIFAGGAHAAGAARLPAALCMAFWLSLVAWAQGHDILVGALADFGRS
jgi:hypothetical protein